MKRDWKSSTVERMRVRLNRRASVAAPRSNETHRRTRLGKAVSVVLATLTLSAAAAHARAPSAADKAFCDRYALIMQQALDVDRSGDRAAIAQFRQTVSRDPQAYLIMPGLGVSMTTPPWITDVTAQSREHCLDQVRLNMRGWLPGDPEAPKAENTPENHVGTVTVMPAKREALADAPTAPPDTDTFEGTFTTQMGSDVKVLFQRHAAICWGGTLVTVFRRTAKPLRTCGVDEKPDAYVVRFPRDSFGEVSVPFSTMRPANVDAAATQ